MLSPGGITASSRIRRNRGLRIDHILLSPALAKLCTACAIDKSLRGGERPSDHAIVVAELNLEETQNKISSAIS